MAKQDFSYNALWQRSRQTLDKLRNQLPSDAMSVDGLSKLSTQELLKRKNYIPNGAKLGSDMLQYSAEAMEANEGSALTFGLHSLAQTLEGTIGLAKLKMSMGQKMLVDLVRGAADPEARSGITSSYLIKMMGEGVGNEALKDSIKAAGLMDIFKKIDEGFQGMLTAEEREQLITDFINEYAEIGTSRAAQYEQEEKIINDLLAARGITTSASGDLISLAQAILESARNLNATLAK